jgi:branched-chain amino acid transport system substrate-binding protein
LKKIVDANQASPDEQRASGGNMKEFRNFGTGIGRRTLLKAGVAATVSQFASPFVITARAAEAIKIGILLPKAGTYAVQGSIGYNGAQMAVADFGGHVLDRPIELVWLDESTPQATQQNMHKLVEQEKVVAVQGGVSSGDILAIMPLADQSKTLLMATGPNATEITGKDCRRYTFRVDLPNRATVQAVYPTLKQHGKKWYFVVAAYAWGIDAFNQMKTVLEKDGGTVLGSDQAPLGTTDYSSYILKLRAANPDVVYVGIGGSDMTNFLKQMSEIGLTGKMPISAPIVNDSDLWAAGPAASTGIYPKIWNYTGAQNTQRSQKFSKDYAAKFGGPPESEGWQDWFGTTAILTAIKETGSTDPTKLVSFLEEHKFEGYKETPIWFRGSDHQLAQPVLVASVKPKITDKYDYFDISAVLPKEASEIDAFYGSQAEVGCSFKT